jgi:hypothetical protein
VMSWMEIINGDVNWESNENRSAADAAFYFNEFSAA